MAIGLIGLGMVAGLAAALAALVGGAGVLAALALYTLVGLVTVSLALAAVLLAPATPGARLVGRAA